MNGCIFSHTFFIKYLGELALLLHKDLKSSYSNFYRDCQLQPIKIEWYYFCLLKKQLSTCNLINL